METPGGVEEGRDSSPSVKCFVEIAGTGAGAGLVAQASEKAAAKKNIFLVIVTLICLRKFT